MVVDMERELTTTQAARLLGVSRQAVIKRIAVGSMNARKAGRNYVIDRASLAGATDDKILREMVERLADVYQPEFIYLFGSKARGDSGPDSDYDLLVVVDDDAPPALRRGRAGYEALRDIPAAVDVLVVTKSYFFSRLHLKASLPGSVVRQGRLLHAA
jgi:uncharacterized protein